jgi:hypothetical protein
MRGLLWMAADVITFVITSPGYGQRLEAIKFAIFYRLFQGSNCIGARRESHDPLLAIA